MREECKLRVFENRVLRRIFGPKRDEVTREWRKLHNVELNDLYFAPNVKNEMGGPCSTYEENRDVYTGLGNMIEREYLGDPGLDGRII